MLIWSSGNNKLSETTEKKRKRKAEEGKTLSVKKQRTSSATVTHFQPTPERVVTTSPSIQDRARKILSRGAMPLVPPARREWKRREVPIVVNGKNITWPPKGWNGYSPDQKFSMWEHTAMSIELELVGTPLERDSLMAKYYFLGLPGSFNPQLVLQNRPDEGGKTSIIYSHWQRDPPNQPGMQRPSSHCLKVHCQ